MRRPRGTRPALTAAAVLLLCATACGTERAGPAGGAGAASPAPRTQVTDPPVDGVRITAVTVPSAAGSRVSAAYEVTNDGRESYTYTVLFSFTASDGGAVGNQRETVSGVGAGRTVRGTVGMDVLVPGAPRVTAAKVIRVTKVPTAEAPAEAGVCPPSGIRLTADEGDAAMGLRVVGLHLENCGEKDYSLDGYPQLSLLDKEHRPVGGVRILRGGDSIATGTGYDDPPTAFTLKPGETAVSGLVWRNTDTDVTTEPLNVPYVRVRAKSGAAPVMVTPQLDLGTTGKLGVGAWRRAER
ncbi:DUF4232 domain-containing protein [Streptomyces sp. NPDC002588]|uniref:DUF4232 domain-containing protein n=1 Tax=Streptomyces sp. NPDC002588 TaxID=3154419 RepID=UPI00332081EE